MIKIQPSHFVEYTAEASAQHIVRSRMALTNFWGAFPIMSRAHSKPGFSSPASFSEKIWLLITMNLILKPPLG